MNSPEPGEWLTELRALYDKAFSYDWDRHVDQLNKRYKLHGSSKLGLLVRGQPPAWFNGDVEAIQPDRWVLVVSLSHQLPSQDLEDHVPDSSWQACCHNNASAVIQYPQFFTRAAELAATALEHENLQQEGPQLTAKDLVFTQICPYTFGRFEPPLSTIRTVVRRDIGCLTAASVGRILVEKARPKLILVNGSPTVLEFDAIYGSNLSWEEKQYPSESHPHLKLWHREGYWKTEQGAIPVVGIPLLGTQGSHDSALERKQLNTAIRELVTYPVAASNLSP